MSTKTFWKKTTPIAITWILCLVAIKFAPCSIILLSIGASALATMAVLDDTEYK